MVYQGGKSETPTPMILDNTPNTLAILPWYFTDIPTFFWSIGSIAFSPCGIWIFVDIEYDILTWYLCGVN